MRGNLLAAKLKSDLAETVRVWAILLIPHNLNPRPLDYK